MEKRYQVFVSSTYEDLKQARQEVIQALLELDCIPSGMELFPAADDTQWELIKKVIDGCDYYILIVAGRYGSINKKTHKSYTQMEYEYALKVKKPIIAFLHAEPSSLPERCTERDSDSRKLLELFRAQVKGKMCKFWRSPEELGALVSRSIVLLQRTRPAPGWIRSSTNNPYHSLERSVQSLEQQTNAIEKQLIPAYREENAKFLRRLEFQVGLARRDLRMGLTSTYLDTKDFDFKSFVNDGMELTVIMSDGQTWLSQHDDALVKRLQDKRRTTTFVFVHPDSPLVPILAKKVKVDPKIYRSRIVDSVTRISTIAPNNASVRLLGHYAVPHLAAFITEVRAYVTLYMHAVSPMKPPSGFEFEPISGDCYYARLKEDANELISISVDIKSFSNGGSQAAPGAT